jgi:hypothetical protein
MKSYLTLIASVVLFTMFSCSSGQKESTPAQVLPSNQPQEIELNADTSTTVVLDTTSLSVPVKPATTVMLNPPHGQPFHRCDIPVGSPLSDAPPAKPAPAVNRTGTAPTLENAARLNNTTVPVAAPTVSNGNAPKLNPPHGQPFHRCEIPVGSPLN